MDKIAAGELGAGVGGNKVVVDYWDEGSETFGGNIECCVEFSEW